MRTFLQYYITVEPFQLATLKIDDEILVKHYSGAFYCNGELNRPTPVF